MTRFIATFCYIGLMRPAPGSWGSAAAVPAAWAIFLLGGWALLTVACGVAFFLGWWATFRETLGQDDHDPSEIVIDEVTGQWIALLPVAIGAAHSGAGFWALWPGVVTAFLAFRLFDIWKPGPIGWADRRGDALGVMLDDILAGIAAAGIVLIGGLMAHGL